MRMLTAMVLAMAMAAGVGAAAPAAAESASGQQDPTAGPRPQGGVPRTPSTGQRVQRPPRDPREPRTPPQPAVGTATVRGRVVDGVTGQPLPRVRVRVMGRARVSMQTDTNGVFSFTRLPAGPLMMSAEKSGYLSVSYPDRRRSLRNTMVNLAEGQTLDNVSLSMFRGGAIAGRVVDVYGEPVENVQLQVIPVQPGGKKPTGGRSMMRGGPGSNDIGEFRIARLEPGSYILLANPMRRGDDEGQTPGRTYFPGAASMDQAQPITIEKGQSVAGLEFPLLETTMVKVSGSVVSSKGEPVTSGGITLRADNVGGLGFSFPEGGTGIRPDGTFELTVQPGSYVLEAMPAGGRGRGPGPGGPQVGSRVMMFNGMSGDMGGENERGMARITVESGEPVSGVVITTGPGARVSGRLVFNGKRAQPTDFRGVGIEITGAPDSDECRSSGRPTINPDGTFVAEGVWGSCQVRASNMANWQFESVMHRGTDITDRAIVFQGGQQVTDLQIVLTDRVGELPLDVEDDRGQPISEFIAVVFPVNKERWRDFRQIRTHVAAPLPALTASTTGLPGGFVGSMTMAAGPAPAVTGMVMMGSGMSSMSGPPGLISTSTGGTPIVTNLLAGEYYVAALEDVSYDDLRDTEFLAQLSSVATRVTITEQGSNPVQLRRIAAPSAR